MIYDYNNFNVRKFLKGKIIIGLIIILAIIAVRIAFGIYLEIIQLDEIGNLSSIYLINLFYKFLFSIIGFIIIFAAVYITTIFIKNNINRYMLEIKLQSIKLPNFIVSAVVAFLGALMSKEAFYQKALNYLNSVDFGTKDPIFNKDIGYYVFQRPFLMSFYEFFSTLWIFIIIYTIAYYLISLFIIFKNSLTLEDLKVKSILRHNLINIAVFFLIKVFSYKFQKEGILFSSFVGVKGAGYTDVHLWYNYYTAAPFILLAIVAAAFLFIWAGKLKRAVMTIAVFPALWIIVFIIAIVMQTFIVNPTLVNKESTYITYNMAKTREAYNLDKISRIDFPAMQDLTPDIIARNPETKNNIRIVSYRATLDTDIQLQSNTNFYSFNDGDIINYEINGKNIPVFITAREISKEKLPDKSYINTVFKYTHGYGIVINPINQLTPEGQASYILQGLRMDTVDKNLKVKRPQIYYGEMTDNNVIVNAANNGNAANKLKEIDYDGNAETVYSGKGGIKLNFLNKLLFSINYADFNMLISGYISKDSKLLLNRDIVSRAQKAVPFLTVDPDPYIILTADGQLKWVLDAYTTTDYYPYSQDASEYGSFNYIRNSVKIIIDAYDGKVKYHIIDKKDPIIKMYSKIYPGIFSNDPLPDDVLKHMRYPELLFKIQTDMLKRYHLEPTTANVQVFYSNQDLWDIARHSPGIDNTSDLTEIEPLYNMVKLPGGIGTKEELILMRPFTPSNKQNMISWLAVRNSYDNYGNMILFSFPKNTNIYGPNQFEVKIKQIDKISKDLSLWNQSGSRAFKGDLVVIPIENSVLYVVPIYIQATGETSIPEVREIIVGYQKGDEIKYGIGADLDAALNDLFAGIKPPPVTPPPPGTTVTPPPVTETTTEKLIKDITDKYNEMKKQLNDLGTLIDQLKK